MLCYDMLCYMIWYVIWLYVIFYMIWFICYMLLWYMLCYVIWYLMVICYVHGHELGLLCVNAGVDSFWVRFFVLFILTTFFLRLVMIHVSCILFGDDTTLVSRFCLSPSFVRLLTNPLKLYDSKAQFQYLFYFGQRVSKSQYQIIWNLYGY